MNALHQELESWNLPPIERMTFDRNPCQGPEFIADFKQRINLKQTFSDQMLSVYYVALKLLKQRCKNTYYVSHTKLSELFNKSQIKANNRTALRDFQQKI